MTQQLKLLSGGAAQGLVRQMEKGSGFEVQGTFGAVGAMRDKVVAGEPCDIIILTQALIEQLAADGHAVKGSETPLGIVKTGIAVKAGQPQPDISSAAALKAALLAAEGIYFPDPVKATAGIHFMKVLQTLGVAELAASRLRTFPNGAAAMREMSQAPSPNVIGCTQVTEILFAGGVELVGLLPREFELATVYTAAVSTRAGDPGAARRFIDMLAGEGAASARRAGGFEPLTG